MKYVVVAARSSWSSVKSAFAKKTRATIQQRTCFVTAGLAQNGSTQMFLSDQNESGSSYGTEGACVMWRLASTDPICGPRFLWWPLRQSAYTRYLMPCCTFVRRYNNVGERVLCRCLVLIIWAHQLRSEPLGLASDCQQDGTSGSQCLSHSGQLSEKDCVDTFGRPA